MQLLGHLETRMDRFAITLEEIKADVSALDAKVDRLDAKVDRLDAKVDRLDAKVDRLSKHLGVDDEIANLEAVSAAAS